MLSLHYQKLLEKIEEHQKKYLVVDEYIINKVLDKLMILRFQLIQVNAVIDFENAVILIMCVIKNNDNSHRQLF